MTESVIRALEAALENQPDDINLLLHIASLLKTANDPQKGLRYCQRLLALDPTHTGALDLAHTFATETGNGRLAEGYRTLLDSLRGASPASAAEEVSPTPKNPSNVTPIGPNTVAESHREREKKTRVRGAGLRLVSDTDDANSAIDVNDEHVYLDDVAGMEHVKKRLHLSFLAPLKNPELMKAYGKSVRGGLMLYGPPGCGKTYIARALAGELGAKFISIGLNDILDMYIGESERKLHEIFETARRYAPAVLFIDEIDALGQKRSQLRSSGMRTLVNQLLAEMDSLGGDNQNLFILAATNHPWDVDSALRRPGRFDRIVAVFPPDAAARGRLFHYYLKDKPLGQIDLDSLVAATQLFSGADLAHVCNAAVEYALEDSIASGEVRAIGETDLQKAINETRPSTLSWFESARNYAMFANESGTYDELLEFIKANRL